jgi:predicted AAA+ superfamily ATPase
MFISRPDLSQTIQTSLQRNPVVALIGPRQCGKTTLARAFVPPDSLNYFDLEDPVSLARLEEPMTALSPLHGLVVLDEIQRRPDLFPILRVLVDRDRSPVRFLILGSASPDLLRQSSESLAGRMENVPMGGLSLSEVGIEVQPRHLLRGGFPRSFLADSDADSTVWRKNFIQTFLERDLPQFGVQVPAFTMLRFWTMLAHYHAQIWNASELGRSLGVSQPTINRYLDTLVGVFMIRQLQPWHANVKKRQVRSPKVYFRDSGLLHQLLGIHTEHDLWTHPKLGASWEGYVIEETIKALQPQDAYFWASHSGAELDLLLLRDGDIQLDHLMVVYPGSRAYSLSDQVTVTPLDVIITDPDEVWSLART